LRKWRALTLSAGRVVRSVAEPPPTRRRGGRVDAVCWAGTAHVVRGGWR
jgi:hypothetical protein